MLVKDITPLSDHELAKNAQGSLDRMSALFTEFDETVESIVERSIPLIVSGGLVDCIEEQTKKLMDPISINIASDWFLNCEAKLDALFSDGGFIYSYRMVKQVERHLVLAGFESLMALKNQDVTMRPRCAEYSREFICFVSKFVNSILSFFDGLDKKISAIVALMHANGGEVDHTYNNERLDSIRKFWF